MFKFLKYIPLVGLFKNVKTSYKEETGKDRPAYLSRRFIGTVIALGGAILAIQFGIIIDTTILEQLTDNIEKLVATVIAIYGIVLAIVGLFKKKDSNVTGGTKQQ